jgi:hypothetical protein
MIAELRSLYNYMQHYWLAPLHVTNLQKLADILGDSIILFAAMGYCMTFSFQLSSHDYKTYNISF